MASAAAINNLGSCAHNPRGNLWYNDESTYGHKMLLRMGWNKGKGLGKNENGIKENIKVKFRNTHSGLGYKDESHANMMKTDYESILKGINAEYSQQRPANGTNEINEQENKSVKQKSRVVKSRIRYPRLYYGKDVSKYSEKDMKSIFICSLPVKDNKEKLEDSEPCIKKESENELPKPIETYSSGLSISDYFNMKMKGKKEHEQNKKANNDVKQLKTFSEFESVEPESFIALSNKQTLSNKKKNSETHINGDAGDLPLVDIESSKVSSKKRKKSSDYSVCEDNFSAEKDCEMLDTTYSQSSTSNRKRKRSQLKENQCASADSNGLSSCETDLYSSTSSIPKKKRKKSHKTENGCKSVDMVELISVSQSNEKFANNFKVVNDSSSSELVNVVHDSVLNNDIHCSKKKKKLKNKLKSLKKLKSCLKSKKKKYSVKNVSFNENLSYKIIDSDYESTECIPQSIVQIDLAADGTDDYKKDLSDNIPTVQDVSFNEQKGNNDVCTEVLETDLVEESRVEDLSGGEWCSMSSLPSSKSSYYNLWVESQKQALHMQLYKNMLKSIMKHDVLKTTNLLSIKGYGNWGFK